jgi:hypothetical protein
LGHVWTSVVAEAIIGVMSDSGVRAGSTRRAVLSASAATLLGATVAASTAGQPAAATGGPGRPAGGQRPDRELRQLLRMVDPRRIEATIRGLTSFGTRHTLSSQDDPARGIGAARDWIFDQLSGYAAASGGAMAVTKQSFVQPVASRIPTPTVITNVIATITGSTTPSRVYVITGHYDSRVTDVMNFTSDAPGADDDGSGVAVVFELARLLATQRPKSTVVLAAVAGEEQGLYGSAFMAKQMKAAGTDVQAMFSNDIVGTGNAHDGTANDPHTVRLFVEGVPTSETPAQAAVRQSVGGENDGASRQLARFAKDVASNGETGMTVRPIWRRDRYLRGSDHISFLQQGYPAGRFTEPRENYAHEHQDTRVENGVQFGDLIEFCDFGYIARVAKVNLSVLWTLAQAPGTPKGALIDTTQLTNLSTLSWQRGTEPDLAGYEIVWRDSAAPDWTHVIDAGDVTSATIDLAKDNVQFGIRAYDTAGHRSPAAAPAPFTG